MHCRNFKIEKGTAEPVEYKGMIKAGEKRVAIILCQEFLNSLAALETRKSRFSQMVAHTFDCLEISYEELLGGRNMHAEAFSEQSLSKIFDFLEIEDREFPVRAATKKVNPTDLEDLIANSEEVVGFFEKNGLRQYVN
jgi:hypothetical protein